MISKQWFQRGFALFDDSKIKKLVSCDDDWQIYTTSFDNYILVVKNSLLRKWLTSGLINEKLFTKIDSNNGEEYYIYSSKPGYLISSVEYGPFPDTKTEAIAFASTLRELRKTIETLSFHDALYIEQCSILLPTYTFTEPVDDQTVLGTWLTAGVKISTSSFRRLCKLLEWMSPKDVEEIINEGGFAADGQYLILPKQKDREMENESIIREQAPKVMHANRFSLPGRPYLEEFFNEHIIDIIMNEDKYKKMGIEFPSAMILYGPPGCGKTYAIEKLIEFLDWPSYSIDSGSIGSPYIHDTSKKIADIFDQAIENAPSVIVIDEMEAFLTDRNIGQSSGLHHVEEVAEFLRRIPEAVRHKVLVVAMTNMIDSIDAAILRRGRFDHILEVKMPSKEEVEILLNNLLKKLPISETIDIEKASQLLADHPLSDVAFVVKEAGRKTVKQGCDMINNSILFDVIDSLPKAKNESRKIGF